MASVLHFILPYFVEVNRSSAFLGMENIYRKAKLLILKSTLWRSQIKLFHKNGKKYSVELHKPDKFQWCYSVSWIPRKGEVKDILSSNYS